MTDELQEHIKKIAAYLVGDLTHPQGDYTRMTRCKFHCASVTKTAYRQPNEPDTVLYTAEFYAVTDGSEENKKFFAWTPSGSLKVGTYREDLFQPGRDYYVDITEVNTEE